MKGIDVSVHNGKIDWKKVKADGIEFAMIRAGYGNVPSQKDKRFEENYMGARGAGLKVGVYWFSYAYNTKMAEEEADVCLSILDGRTLDMPIAFDFEYASVNYAARKGVTVTRALATEIAAVFTKKIRAAGYDSMIYTNYDYISRYYDLTKLQDSYLWLAVWSSNRPTRPHSMWQYSAEGHVSGISGKVDMNYCYEKFAKKPKITTEKQPDPEVIKHTVKKGETLWGIAKKYGTTYGKIAKDNGIKNPNLIYPGQVFVIKKDNFER